MNIFILAAGLGNRLKPLTILQPKPAVPFLNVPMGYFAFRYLHELRPSQLVVNSFHLADQVSTLYRTNVYWSGRTDISHDGNAILGSAGGLKKAAKFFTSQDTLLMINSDEVFFCSDASFLQRAREQHEKTNSLATLLVTAHPQAGKKFGAIWCDEQKNALHIGKTCESPQLRPWHYIGYVFLHPEVLALIEPDKESNILYDVLIHHLSRVQIFPIDCRWYETGNGPDYLEATKICLQKIDSDTLAFINRYDKSKLVTNEAGLSLISEKVSINEKSLRGYNVISGSTQMNLLNSSELISDSVFFEDIRLNARYFSET